MAGRALNAIQDKRRSGRKPKWVDKAWRDMVRRAACEVNPENGNQYMFEVARTLVRLAAAGDVSAIKEFGDRIDGRVNPGKEGSGETTLNFVVALPAVVPAEQWQASWSQSGEGARLINASLPAQPTAHRMRDGVLRTYAGDAEQHNDKESAAPMTGIADKSHDAEGCVGERIGDHGKGIDAKAGAVGSWSVGHDDSVRGASRGEGVSVDKSEAPEPCQPVQPDRGTMADPSQESERVSAFGEAFNSGEAGASNVVAFNKGSKDDG